MDGSDLPKSSSSNPLLRAVSGPDLIPPSHSGTGKPSRLPPAAGARAPTAAEDYDSIPMQTLSYGSDPYDNLAAAAGASQAAPATSLPDRVPSQTISLPAGAARAADASVPSSSPMSSPTLGGGGRVVRMNTRDMTETDNTCSKCGNVFMPDAVFCRKCGAKREGGFASSGQISRADSSASQGSGSGYGFWPFGLSSYRQANARRQSVAIGGAIALDADNQWVHVPAERVSLGESQASHEEEQIPRPKRWTLWLLIFCASFVAAIISFSIQLASSVLSLKLSSLWGDNPNDQWAQVPKHWHFWVRLAVQVSLAVLAYWIALVLTAPSRKQIGQFIGGSGIPELKCELGGVHLTGMFSTRILLAKVLGLTIALGAGLPVGSEGPFVHMSTCVVHLMMRYIPIFQPIMVHRNLRLVAMTSMVAVGVACAFTAPVGGVLYALEITEMFGSTAYLHCFLGATVAGLMQGILRSFAKEAGITVKELFSVGDLPSMDVDYAESWQVMSHLFIWYIALGVVCGVVGAAFVKAHRQWVKIVGCLVNGAAAFRVHRPKHTVDPEPPPNFARFTTPATTDNDQSPSNFNRLQTPFSYQDEVIKGSWTSYLHDSDDSDGSGSDSENGDGTSEAEPSQPSPLAWRKKVIMCLIVAAVAALNSILTWWIPLLHDNQATLIEEFSKASQPNYGTEVLSPVVSLTVCLMIKLLMTVLVVGLPLPVGTITPTFVIGAMLGRLMGWIVRNVQGFSNDDTYTNGLLGRFALLGSSAFCAGSIRSFAQVVLVYARTGLPAMLLPLCITSLTAIFVANTFELGFFDSAIRIKKLPHLAALAQGREALSVVDVMRPASELPQLPPRATEDLLETLNREFPRWAFEVPIVTHHPGNTITESERGMLLCAVKTIPATLADFNGMMERAVVPLQVPAHTELKTLLPILNLMNKTCAFVTRDGQLLGAVTLQDLNSRATNRGP